MSDTTIDTAADLDARLRRDGLILNPEDRAFLLEVMPTALEWSQAIRISETRYSEPAMIHPVKPGS